MTNSTLSASRTLHIPVAASGDLAIVFGYMNKQLATNWTMTGGTSLINMNNRGVCYKFLGASDAPDLTLVTTSTSYSYYFGIITFRKVKAASPIHAFNATTSITTTIPCTVIAFSDATTITMADGIPIPNLYSQGAALPRVLHNYQEVPGTLSWTHNGTWGHTIAVSGIQSALVWNGTSWRDDAEVWNGTAWKTNAEIYNGTSYVPL